MIVTDLQQWFDSEADRMEGPFYSLALMFDALENCGRTFTSVPMIVVCASPERKERIAAECAPHLSLDAIAALAECFTLEEAESLAAYFRQDGTGLQSAMVMERFARAEDAADCAGLLDSSFDDSFRLYNLLVGTSGTPPIYGVVNFRILESARLDTAA